jgi:hypothetical protein
VQLFPNQLPARLSEELATARKLRVRPLTVRDPEFDTAVNAGTVKWVVNSDGELVIVQKYVDGQEISHTVLTNGQPVIAAGEADITGFDGYYYLLNITNHSGHYQPSASSIEIGREVFQANGINIPD